MKKGKPELNIEKVMSDSNLYLKRLGIEKDEQWYDCFHMIPELQFKPNWRVKILPPVGGALVRFHISTDKGAWISVYLDFFERLGCPNMPYWELYDGDDTYRFPAGDSVGLQLRMMESIREQEDVREKRVARDTQDAE